MFKASQLKEAAAIVAQIAQIQDQRKLQRCSNRTVSMTLSHPVHHAETSVAIHPDDVAWLEKRWRDRLDARETELRRRAAQLDLAIDS